MIHCPLWCKGEHAQQKEQTHQKRIELWALWLCHDGPIPLFQEELEHEEVPPRVYHLGWELGDWLFLIHILPELPQVNLQATTTTSQHLAEEAKCSMEAQATTTLLLYH